MKDSAPYLPEIDGLRAIAITPVVLFHAGVPHLGGGYVGVDVFFVLSGFLITRLLHVELEQTGTIDFTTFYARRVRRLLPALATVVAVVLVFGSFILSPALERQELSKSAIATMAFVSNFYFWRAQAIYFAPPADWIPLLNMWTLSVEEQFYLLWPALMIAAAWLGRRTGRAIWPSILLILLALTFLSFALFFWGAYAKQTAAFYLAPTRAWEFALGGVLALSDRRLQSIRRIGGVAAIVGLAFILIAVTLLHSFFLSVSFAAFGAMAAIAGITSARDAFVSRLLRTRPMTIIGRLSYSWYLWHWPLLAFTRVLAPGDISLTRTLVVSFAALALAALTFVFIEDPIRRKRPWPFFTSRQTFVTGGTISLMVACLAGALHLQADAAQRRDPWLTRYCSCGPPGAAHARLHLCADVFRSRAAASMLSWGSSIATADFGLGDSQARQLLPLMQTAGERGAYRAVIWSMASCPTVVVNLPVQRGLGEACRAFNRAVAAELPALVRSGVTGIVSVTRNFGFPGLKAPAEKLSAWQSDMRQVLSMAHDMKIRVLIIAPIAVFPLMLPECLAHGSPSQCGSSRAIVETERAPLMFALAEITAAYDNVRIWDPLNVICDARLCTPVRNGTIIYSDRGHLSELGSRGLFAFVTPELRWLTVD